jgi:hypothetical protein
MGHFDPHSKEVVDAVSHVHTYVHRLMKMHKGAYKSAFLPKKGRRLDAVPNFATMCASPCWNDIKTGMLAFMTAAETACPKTTPAPCSPSTPAPAAPTSKPENNTCLFDTCSGTIGRVCASSALKDQVVKANPCSGAAVEFVCGAICGTSCTANSAEERKLFCPTGNTQKDDDDDGDQCEQGGSQSAEAMAGMFNFLCLKNSANNIYCQAKGMELSRGGAFAGSPTEEFPDPCNVDCSGPTGKAIAELGCCMGSLIQVNEKHKLMTHAELVSAKAATFKCGGAPAMTACNDAGAGLLVSTETVLGTKKVASCPTTAAAAKAEKINIANWVKMTPADVSLVACPRAGTNCMAGGGRRLETSSDQLQYSVSVTGTAATIASKKAAVQASATTLASAGPGAAAAPGSGAGLVGGAVSVSVKSLGGLLMGLLWLNIS